MNDNAPAATSPVWTNVIGAPIVSVMQLILSGLALVCALWMYLHDGTAAPLVGAIGLMLGKGSTVVDYWLGSSKGSQAKDDAIASRLPLPVPPPSLLNPIKAP